LPNPLIFSKLASHKKKTCYKLDINWR
jgi:hypothetical protein